MMEIKPAQSKQAHEEAILNDILGDLDLDELHAHDADIDLDIDTGDDEILLVPTGAESISAPTEVEQGEAEQIDEAVAAEPETTPKKAAKPKKAKEPKEKVERVYYANKIDRLKARVAESFDTVITENGIDEQALRDIGVKVQNRVTFLVEFATGKTTKLNGVMQSGLELLHNEGMITTGEKGNYITNLVAGGKKMGTAKSMSGNAVSAMRVLNIIKQESAGKFVPNEDSPLLQRLNDLLSLKTK